ncbi:TPR-like protein [Rhizoctonia solani]|uniref:TPR-like protein n=1 Tax=Rhizoctonia solani TaxID=456999 RepID=A0A8H7I690_9AGAM|nr:TPR-like protein [Rhizoctonia solani]
MGVARISQFQHSGRLEDAKHGVEHLTQAVAQTPPRHPDMPSRLSSLGNARILLFQHFGRLENIEHAIECLTQAVAQTPLRHPDMPSRLSNLGVAHMSRFKYFDRPEDAEHGIAYLTQAVAQTPPRHPDMPSWLIGLGNAYISLFQHFGRLGHIEHAIKCLNQAVAQTPPQNPDIPSRLGGLGSAHMLLFKQFGRLEDIEHAIEYLTQAVAQTPLRHPDIASQLSNLGNARISYFRHFGELEDIEHAIQCLTQAVAQTPPQNPDMPSRLSSLGNARISLFQHFGRHGHIEHAVECLTQAVAQTPLRHPDMPSQLSNLGNARISLFRYFGRMEDIEQAVHRLSSLGSARISLFQHFGRLEDIEHAIECLTRAVVQTPAQHPGIPSWLSNLGNAYMSRFQHLGDIQDADRAIQYLASASQLQTGHVDQCNTLANLGKAYSNRFRRLRHTEDLNQAIKCEAQAVELAPNNHVCLSSFLTSLGASLQERFIQTGCTQHLDNAIICHREAVSQALEIHIGYASYLNNLGNAYLSRFGAVHQQEDIAEAIDHFKKAIACTHKGHVDLPGRLANLSNALREQYKVFEDPTVLERAIEAQTQAVSLVPAGICREAAFMSSTLSLSDTMAAFQLAIDMIPQLIWVGATVEDRYRNLPLLGDLTQRAAVAAVDAGDYSLALEWLEQGRSIVWSQTLQLQTPLGELSSRYPKLAHALKETATELSRASSDPVPPILDEPRTGNPQSHHQDLRGHRIRSTAARYESLLSEARSIPGFERFMLPRKASELLQAASNHPIIVVNLHESRCDALALVSGSSNIQHIPLPNMTYEKAMIARIKIRYSLNGRSLEERSNIRGAKPMGKQDYFPKVLATLWTDLVQPVLQALGYMPRCSEELPHLTWCMTGPLSFLPIHAAGYYDRPMEKLSDYAITSYTPTLAALLPRSRTCSTSLPSLLAVGQAATPKMTPLPGATTELAIIEERTPSGINYKQLDGMNAQVSSVLEAMKSCSCVHSACHAHQNLTHPTNSGFYLHDGTLTLRDIMQQSFKDKHLAFLSACQTAKGDDGLPDEAVHLASGMLMAGYPSVIATMWSIADVHAPMVADEVYARLMKKGSIGPGDTARALHYAVAKLREQLWPKDFVLWMPYIHIGI